MAHVVAWGSLMARRPTILAAALRLTTWILPPQRKEWAEAMLNEMAYLGSRRAAMFWVLGAALFAIRERASFELVSMLQPSKTSKILLGLSLATVFTVVGVYIIQKPYQRERILLHVFHGCRKSGCPPQ